MVAPGSEYITFEWTVDKVDMNRLRTVEQVRESMGLEPLIRSILAKERSIALFDDDGSLKFLRDDVFLPGTDLGRRILRAGLSINGKDRPLYVLEPGCLNEAALRKMLGTTSPPRNKRSIKPVRRRGPAARKLNRVIDEMRAFGGYDAVRGMTEEAMAEQFRASRYTCREARNRLMAEKITH